MADRLVSDPANTVDHLPSKAWRSLSFDHRDAVITDNDVRIGVALGAERLKNLADLAEADGFFFHVVGGCECFAYVFSHAATV